jgi:hypothetical protein
MLVTIEPISTPATQTYKSMQTNTVRRFISTECCNVTVSISDLYKGDRGFEFRRQP